MGICYQDLAVDSDPISVPIVVNQGLAVSVHVRTAQKVANYLEKDKRNLYDWV